MGMSSTNHARARGGRRFRPMAEINVTPFVDVVLVLLVIFMVSAPLLSQGVALDLPKTDANALPNESEPLVISVDAEGLIFLQNTEVELDELVPRLTAIAENGFEERIRLRVDGEASYENAMRVMSRINVAGFSNLGLETDPLEQ